ncbi:hypothetical protein [Chitinophaga sp.]|uniref:hypothetical protein n=1 Tax=Chitinophaga sp. TaxID=1869181 RepID=UPI002F94A15B
MEEIQPSWKAILNKYGSNALYIAGDDLQPNYEFSFDLSYQNTGGRLAFSWTNTAHDYDVRKKYERMLADDPRRIYHNYLERTILLLALPAQHNRLKIFDNGKIIGLLSQLHPHQIKTGYLDFDSAFITIAKPTTIVSGLMPYLQFLLHPSLGGSVALDTRWQDAQTAKFCLRLQVNQFLTTEEAIETMLEGSFKLVKQLSLYA